MGNTTGIDMGNSFEFISRPFHTYVMERTFGGGATVAVCEVGLEGPTKHVAVVSAFWNEPQERLQVGGAIRAGRASRFARSGLPAALFAAADFLGVVGPDSAFAAAISKLGQQETGSANAQRTSPASGSLCPDRGQVVAANEAEPPSAPPLSPRAAGEAGRVDHCATQQSSVDGGLQRLVSNGGWPAGGTADGARFVQSLCIDGPLAQESELEAISSGFLALVPGERLSRGDSRGQWRSLRIHRASGADALERLVDGAGDSGRIHCAWASGTEWSPRADAPGVQGRNDTPALVPSASAATAHRPLGERLQPDSSARSSGAASAGGGLSSPTRSLSERTIELSRGLGCASSAQQRRDQMAGEEALCGGSVRRVSGRAETQVPRRMRDLFRGTADRRAAGGGPWRNASGEVCTAEVILPDRFGPGEQRQRGASPRPARWPALHSGSLRSPPWSAGQRAVFPSSTDHSCVTQVCARSVTHLRARRPP